MDNLDSLEFVSLALDSNKKPLLFIDLYVQKFPAEPLKTLIDSGATSNFSPLIVEKYKIPKTQLKNPQVVRMLDGSPHRLGQWPHPLHPISCLPIGNTPAILGMTWLTAEAPLIDWQQGLVTFPEQVQIASKEEVDSDPLADLPPQEYDISIDLVPDAKLSPGPIYGMTDAESKALKQHIDKGLAMGKIRLVLPQQAPQSCLKLNDVTHKNVYPLPRQDNLMAKLWHAKIFTKLDLRWGYNNVQIKKGNEWKTAFRTKYGLFEYLVMPFGLTNAPAAFQHFMNNLFRNLIDVTVVIYLDDILIFSENPKDHPIHVREVLSWLMKNQLFCKLSKCHFHVTTVDYLGIVISPAGFSMDQKKIKAVTTWPHTQNCQTSPSLPRFCQLPPPLHS
ncbi:Reverse transcriptase (RNA-dependent DNA polymerase) [Rhizoctonia solani]|uniref:Reverse transcriptase (RNA-dependent DNA polymerase) n=1 Tax=Rhizoctonia solani TaxID=456999 RepID=A0A8H8P473_9AGAM|nr:Reverse transcriptase (RNA-dependent DNA polymerase) [Rhizoctonia solani]QRW23513.1 Reverse transcriptase (RNA-dependent DNA polymerase) [Rhizoctonia solani]